MYQVVASDLDGTLLSPDHFLTPYAKETLKLLTARGINFVFATGRHYIDVGQIRDNLGIRSYMIPLTAPAFTIAMVSKSLPITSIAILPPTCLRSCVTTRKSSLTFIGKTSGI